jgi:hypothetical protein
MQWRTGNGEPPNPTPSASPLDGGRCVPAVPHSSPQRGTPLNTVPLYLSYARPPPSVAPSVVRCALPPGPAPVPSDGPSQRKERKGRKLDTIASLLRNQQEGDTKTKGTPACAFSISLCVLIPVSCLSFLVALSRVEEGRFGRLDWHVTDGTSKESAAAGSEAQKVGNMHRRVQERRKRRCVASDASFAGRRRGADLDARCAGSVRWAGCTHDVQA